MDVLREICGHRRRPISYLIASTRGAGPSQRSRQSIELNVVESGDSNSILYCGCGYYIFSGISAESFPIEVQEHIEVERFITKIQNLNFISPAAMLTYSTNDWSKITCN